MSFFNRFRKQTSETQGERIEPGRAELDALDEPKEPVLGQPSGAGMNLRPNAPEANVDALSGAAPSVSGAFTTPTAPSASNPFDVPRMPSAPTTGTADAASVDPWQTFSSPSATSTGASPFPSSSAPTSAPTTSSASGSTFADLGASYGAAVGTNGTSNTNGMAGTNPASASFAAPAAPAVSSAPSAASVSPAVEPFRAASSAADAAQSRGFTAAASGSKGADVEAQTPIAKPVPRDKAVAPKRTKMVQVEVPSDEELAARRRTRHRLVGAAALLMAVVVAAPFVLDSESSYEELPLQTEIPPVPTESAPLDVPDVVPSTASPEAPAETAPVAPPAKVDAKPEAPAKPATKPETKPEAKPDAKAPVQGAQENPKVEAQPEKKPVRSVGITPPTGKGYYVQIVATSSELEAEKYVKRLALLGLPAYRIPVERPGATLWRVRVGLFKDAHEAEGAKGTIVLNGVAQKPMVGQQ